MRCAVRVAATANSPKTPPGPSCLPRAPPAPPSPLKKAPQPSASPPPKLRVQVQRAPFRLTSPISPATSSRKISPTAPSSSMAPPFAPTSPPRRRTLLRPRRQARPLDRRNQAFANWNTDNFGWQESTDPIYKSIPTSSPCVRELLPVSSSTTPSAPASTSTRSTATVTPSAPRAVRSIFIFLWPEPQGGRPNLGLAHRPHTPSTPLVARLSAVPLELLPRSRSPPHRRPPALRRIPADVIWLDIDYQLKNRPFTVDPSAFPISPR